MIAARLRVSSGELQRGSVAWRNGEYTAIGLAGDIGSA